MTASRWSCMLLILLLSSPGLAEEKGDAYVSRAHGFAVEKPGADWAFQEKESGAPKAFQLTVYSKTLQGRLMLTVRVKAPSIAGATAEAIRDKILASLRGKANYENAAKTSLTVAGRQAPGLQVEVTAKGVTWRVQQYYLLEKGLEYTLGYSAHADLFDARRPHFLSLCKTFRFRPREAAEGGTARLEALAARCGAEMPWAKSWQEAAAYARQNKRLVLVMVRKSGGFQTGNQFVTWAFMNPDVVNMARLRFVAWAYRAGTGAPFEADAVYGLGPSTFGTSLLVATPDGKVIGDTACPHPAAVHDLMVRTLAAQAGLCEQTPPANLAGAHLATWHLVAGNYRRAAALLKEPGTTLAFRAKASLLRRLRRGDYALDMLDKAGGLSDPEGLPDLAVERALVLLRMGREDEAYSVLASMLHRSPRAKRSAEARYWLGACTCRLAGTKAAAGVWKALVEKHPKSFWARKAAAQLTSAAFRLGSAETARWPAPEVMDTLRPADLEPCPVERAREAEEKALAYLLARQRSDGSWIYPSEALRAGSRIPSDMKIAISSACVLSLLAYRDRPAVSRAIHLGLGYLRQARAIRKAVGDKVYFMDYGVWNRAYLLLCLASCAKLGLVPRAWAKETMDEIIAELRKRQKSGGGWSYYVSRDLSKAGSPANQSISFCTAAVVLALARARDAGVTVPEKVRTAAVGCLARMHNPDGTFEYMLFHGAEDKPRKPNLEGAAGRGPVCTLALLAWGRGGTGRVRQVLSLFEQQLPAYAKLKRKTLMHTAPGGQGSHYLLFDYAHAAVAASLLPPAEGARHRGVILAQILALRGSDGGFVDNPMIGPHAGTAFALLAFQALKKITGRKQE